MKPKVLVTGSAGFIAPHILEECKNKGWSSWGLDVLDPKDEDSLSIKETAMLIKKNNRLTPVLLPVRDGILIYKKRE